MRIDDGLYLLGVRHHGPGSAASLVAALEAIRPDALLLEGPAEAEAVLELAGDEQMRPPVAQLIYALDDPGDCAFYPFAEFSPEWQAIRYAQRQGLPLRLCDLPQSQSLALARRARETSPSGGDRDGAAPEPETPVPRLTPDDSCTAEPASTPADPLDLLAAAAGFSDGERWWEHVVEQRSSDLAVFAAIGEAISALRERIEPERPSSLHERRREAWMRQTLRETRRQGHARIAVVCGAWHVPALAAVDDIPPKHDNALLKALPKLKTRATWVPWTHGRIASASGYRAGVAAPGWYAHLWRERHAGGARARRVGVGWLARTAHLLREQGIDVSSASVIEAVRLAESLAALRGQALPGLGELHESARSVLCFGDDAPLRLIERSLLTAETLGAVPASTPTVPLAADLTASQKRLRLAPQAVEKTLELDLRQPLALQRSRLLHRLTLLGLPWGKRLSNGGKGTFKERWQLQWQPEFAVRLIEASVHGNTVAGAADRASRQKIAGAELDDIVATLGALLLADLPGALGYTVQTLQRRAALSADVSRLMIALGPLARIVRYSDVRGTDAATLEQVIDGLTARVCAGLAGVCRSLDAAAAAALSGHIDAVDEALRLLERAALREPWLDALNRVAELDDAHPRLAGRAVRLLLDGERISAEETGRRLRFALSRAAPAAEAAGWLEGFLAGSGALLLHDDVLWGLIDDWLLALSEDTFVQLLPLLRRSFAGFEFGLRRQLLDKARRGVDKSAAAVGEQSIDARLAAACLPLLARLLERAAPGADAP